MIAKHKINGVYTICVGASSKYWDIVYDDGEDEKELKRILLKEKKEKEENKKKKEVKKVTPKKRVYKKRAAKVEDK